LVRHQVLLLLLQELHRRQVVCTCSIRLSTASPMLQALVAG
jgi:hypothetical protein